jgi:predicted transcriptional regulator
MEIVRKTEYDSKPNKGRVILQNYKDRIVFEFSNNVRREHDANFIVDYVEDCWKRSHPMPWLPLLADLDNKCRPMIIIYLICELQHQKEITSKLLGEVLNCNIGIIQELLVLLTKRKILIRSRKDAAYFYQIANLPNYEHKATLSDELISAMWGSRQRLNPNRCNAHILEYPKKNGSVSLVSRFAKNHEVRFTYSANLRTREQAIYLINAAKEYYNLNGVLPLWCYFKTSMRVKVQSKQFVALDLIARTKNQGCTVDNLVRRLNLHAYVVERYISWLLLNGIIKSKPNIASGQLRYYVPKDFLKKEGLFADNLGKDVITKDIIDCLFGANINKARGKQGLSSASI